MRLQTHACRCKGITHKNSAENRQQRVPSGRHACAPMCTSVCVRVATYRPGEVDAAEQPLVLRDAILERALVERVGRELREARVHAVLHLQPDRPDAEQHEALEERLRQAGTLGALAHDDGTELAVVADEHDLLGAQHDGDDALGLGRLRRLVDQHLCAGHNHGAKLHTAITREADSSISTCVQAITI